MPKRAAPLQIRSEGCRVGGIYLGVRTPFPIRAKVQGQQNKDGIDRNDASGDNGDGDFVVRLRELRDHGEQIAWEGG
jgi:hypothetical protein